MAVAEVVVMAVARVVAIAVPLIWLGMVEAVTAGEPRIGAVAGMLLGALWLVLLVQIGLLRRRLDRRAMRALAGDNPPRSLPHPAYIALEAVKDVMLLALGSSLIMGLTA